MANADLDAEAISNHVQFLDERSTSGPDYLGEQFDRAAADLGERPGFESTA